MGSLFSESRRVKYFLCMIDDLTKYSLVKFLKNEIAKKVVNDFIEMVKKSKCQHQIYYGLIEEESFTIALCKNGSTLMMFYLKIMRLS